MSTDQPIRLESIDAQTCDEHGTIWTYATAGDTGVRLAIAGAHMEPDGDEDSTWLEPTFDALKIVDESALRELTDEEADEYTDDVRTFIRCMDWEA